MKSKIVTALKVASMFILLPLVSIYVILAFPFALALEIRDRRRAKAK